jgi:PAS domain S-box-containing protein
MSDREKPARDDEYEALSRRIVDVVLDKLGCDLGSDNPEMLRQVQDSVCAELARQAGTHIGGLCDVSEWVRVPEQMWLQVNILDQVGDAVIAVDAEERVTYLNNRALEQYGLQGQDVLGRKLSDLYEYRFLDPGDESAASAALAEEGRWRGRNLHIRRDGKELTVESTVVTLDAVGRGPGLLAIVRDITEQVEREHDREHLLSQAQEDRLAISELAAVLEQERDLLGTIMDSTQAQIAYLDPEFRFVQVNDAYCQGSGYDRAELIGRNHFDLFPNDENQTTFEQVRDTGEAIFFRAKPFSFPDRPELGTTYWDWSLTATRDRKGEAAGLVLSLYDVTERERAWLAQDELVQENRSQREFLQRLMEAAPVGIAVVRGRDYRYEYVNPYYQNIPGVSDVPMVGRTIAQVFPEVAAQGALSLVDEARRTNEVVSIRAYEASVGPGREHTYWNVDHVPMMVDGTQVPDILILAHEVTDEVIARRELDAERARLRAIIDNAPEGIIVVDEASHIVLTNAAADGLYAQPVSCAADDGTYIELAFCYPDGTPYEPRELPLTRSALQGETCVNQEMSVLGADGGRHDLLASSAPIYDGQGEVDGAVGLFQDVTELRQAQRALNESQERLRLALSAAEMGTWHWDFQTDTITRDSGLVRILGLEPSESTQSEGNLLQKVHPDDRAAVAAEIERAIRDHSFYLVECRIVRSDGAVRWVRAQGRVFYDADERASSLTGVVTDLTEQVEARVEMERLRQRNELILMAAGEGIFGLDREGRVTFANPAAISMTGWTAEELVGRSHHEVVHHTQVDGTPYPWGECLIQSTLADGATYSVSDEVFWRKDGTSFPVEYTSTPIVESGEVEGAVLVFRDISERKQAQKEIADLARFPDENPHPVIRVSRGGVILYANRGSVPILAEWGVQVGQRVPVDWQKRTSRAISEGEVSVEEVSVQERTFALAIAPLEEYVNLYGLDVTTRKRAEDALQRYAERLRVLRETDQAILAAQTAEEIASSALRHMQRLVPFSWASVTLFDAEAGGMLLLAVHPEGETEWDRAWRRPIHDDQVLATLLDGQIHVTEDLGSLASPSALVERLRSQGVLAYANVPLIAQGTLIGSLNLGMAMPGVPDEEEIEIAQEIADELAIGIQQARLLAQVQRHAEELEHQVRRRTAALRASRARFQAVFEEAAIGIALVDRKGCILDSNPALQRMLGHARDELEGMVFSDFAHADNVANDAELYEELVAGRRSYYRVEGRYVRRDGQAIDANLTVSLVQPTKGRARFAIALVEDVTERKQAQAALIESEKLALTGRMAASLAHEINNPLQSVIGCLSLAEEDLTAGENPLQYVRIALEELERAADLIARMRDLNRQHEADEQVPTDTNALVERVLILTKKKCEERHVEVAWEPGTDLPKPSVVRGRMQQVFLNLVLNAVDAMSDGGRLLVSTACTTEPQGVQVRFADSGVGIAADHVPHLFEPFYTTKVTGMGLGLYVSHRIVKEHGGRVDVESIEGEGTTFTVWLPA